LALQFVYNIDIQIFMKPAIKMNNRVVEKAVFRTFAVLKKDKTSSNEKTV